MVDQLRTELVGDDRLTPVLQKAEAAFASTGQAAEHLSAQLGRAGAAADTYHGKLQQAQTSTVALGAAIGVASAGATVALHAIGSAAGAAFGALYDSAIKSSAGLEQSRIAFTTMLGSAEKAGAFLKDLQVFAAQTPFEFPELVTASKRMLAFGFEAEQVKPILTAVGNAAAAMGSGAEGMNRITTALGQMQAKGRVQAEEMLQLTEAGIPAWDMLAKKIGTDVPTAMDKVTKGLITAQTFQAAFQEGVSTRFGDMMAAQATTFYGAMSTVRDSLNMAIVEGFAPFFAILRDSAVEVAAFLQSADFAAFTASVGQGMKDAAVSFQNFAGTVHDTGVQVGTTVAFASDHVDTFVRFLQAKGTTAEREWKRIIAPQAPSTDIGTVNPFEAPINVEATPAKVDVSGVVTGVQDAITQTFTSTEMGLGGVEKGLLPAAQRLGTNLWHSVVEGANEASTGSQDALRDTFEGQLLRLKGPLHAAGEALADSANVPIQGVVRNYDQAFHAAALTLNQLVAMARDKTVDLKDALRLSIDPADVRAIQDAERAMQQVGQAASQLTNRDIAALVVATSNAGHVFEAADMAEAHLAAQHATQAQAAAAAAETNKAAAAATAEATKAVAQATKEAALASYGWAEAIEAVQQKDLSRIFQALISQAPVAAAAELDLTEKHHGMMTAVSLGLTRLGLSQTALKAALEEGGYAAKALLSEIQRLGSGMTEGQATAELYRARLQSVFQGISQDAPIALQAALKAAAAAPDMEQALTATLERFGASFPGLIEKAIRGTGVQANLAMHDLGVLMREGLESGILGRQDAIGEVFRGVLQKAIQGARAFLKTGSPSRLTAEELGEPMGEGIADGIAQAAPQVQTAIQALTGDAITTARGQVVSGSALLAAAVETLGSRVAGVASSVLGQANLSTATALRALQTPYDQLVRMARGTNFSLSEVQATLQSTPRMIAAMTAEMTRQINESDPLERSLRRYNETLKDIAATGQRMNATVLSGGPGKIGPDWYGQRPGFGVNVPRFGVAPGINEIPLTFPGASAADMAKWVQMANLMGDWPWPGPSSQNVTAGSIFARQAGVTPEALAASFAAAEANAAIDRVTTFGGAMTGPGSIGSPTYGFTYANPQTAGPPDLGASGLGLLGGRPFGAPGRITPGMEWFYGAGTAATNKPGGGAGGGAGAGPVGATTVEEALAAGGNFVGYNAEGVPVYGIPPQRQTGGGGGGGGGGRVGATSGAGGGGGFGVIYTLPNGQSVWVADAVAPFAAGTGLSQHEASAMQRPRFDPDASAAQNAQWQAMAESFAQGLAQDSGRAWAAGAAQAASLIAGKGPLTAFPDLARAGQEAADSIARAFSAYTAEAVTRATSLNTRVLGNTQAAYGGMQIAAGVGEGPQAALAWATSSFGTASEGWIKDYWGSVITELNTAMGANVEAAANQIDALKREQAAATAANLQAAQQQMLNVVGPGYTAGPFGTIIPSLGSAGGTGPTASRPPPVFVESPPDLSQSGTRHGTTIHQHITLTVPASALPATGVQTMAQLRPLKTMLKRLLAE